MRIFYFTSTGNSLAVAKRAGGKKALLVSIPQIIDEPAGEYTDDVIGVIFPIYGFYCPKMVRRFFAEKKLTADYIFAIGTYGNIPGACMRNVQRYAAEHGNHLDYAESLLMFDNYLPVFEARHESEVRMPKKNTEQNLVRIIADISERKKRDDVPGIGARVMTAIIQAGEKAVINGKQAQNYIVDRKCVKCGVCARICPSGNISVTDKVTFGDRCEWCLGCVHNCPSNAIHLKNEKSGERWRNPDVTLAELILSNNRTGGI
jgi:ferredoxin